MSLKTPVPVGRKDVINGAFVDASTRRAYAFDFFGTLDIYEEVREIAREAFAKGHEVHIVTAISLGLPMDYAAALAELKVPFTAIHRVDHDPALKVEVLNRLGDAVPVAGFWDDLQENIEAALEAGFPCCLVGHQPAREMWQLHRTTVLV